MSGKNKLPQWGGSRQGSGRKSKPASVRQLNAMLRKGRKWAKEEGYGIDEFLLRVVYGKEDELGCETPLRDRITCARLWKELTMTKVSEHNMNVTKRSAPVILPERRPDPAKLIPIQGKKAKVVK